MTRFWLVRHGPTHAKCMVGWSDLPADLSDIAALNRLNGHLPADAPVISSDLSRAATTADTLTGHRRLPHDPRLREMNFGHWEMRPFNEIEAETPDLIRAFWETPGDIRPPDGESWNDLCDRVLAALAALNGTAPDIIVVAHFGPIVAAIQAAEGLAPEAAFGHRIDNLSVTTLTLSPPQTFAIDHKP